MLSRFVSDCQINVIMDTNISAWDRILNGFEFWRILLRSASRVANAQLRRHARSWMDVGDSHMDAYGISARRCEGREQVGLCS